MVGLVVGEEALVQGHPKAVADATNQSSDISVDIDGIKTANQALAWGWSSPPGFPGDLAGVVRVHDGCRVHRVAPAASPVGAAAADEDDEEEETQAGRRVSPAHGEPSMAAEENSHLLKQECCGGRGEKGSGARFREDGSVEWSSWKWSPRSAGGDRSPRLKIQI
jgi:hypothetical protein